MRRFAPSALVAALLAVAWVGAPAFAGDLPQFPKAHPPQPLPEPPCDTSKVDNGGWLLGGWVAPQTRIRFSRSADDIHWTMDRKGAGGDFGWQEGAVIEGKVTAVSACTLHMEAGGGAFVFEGVLTEEGRIYGYATNKAGDDVRFVLRRER